MTQKVSGSPIASTLDGTELVGVSQVVSTVLTTVKTTVALIGAFVRSVLGVWSKNQSVTPVTLTYAATVTPDASRSNNFVLVLTGACTLATPTNLTNGMVLNFVIDQDVTGGRVLTLSSAFKALGTAPTWVTSASAHNFLSCYYDGTYLRYSGGGFA